MLLERDTYLAQLEALFDRALENDGRAVFLVGEAGIGKTSLLASFAERAASRARVLLAACEDLSAPEALSLLRDLSIVDQHELERAGRGQSRLALFNEILDELAREPTVLILEDLHWADEASLDFVRFVGRRLAGAPLLMVASSRNDDNEAKQRLHRAAVDVPAAARTLIKLPRLSPEAVGRLAAAHGLIGHAIHDVTGGNPLFVSEMLSTRGRRPALIDELVMAKAAALSAQARELLDFCSIFPRRTPYSSITAAEIGEPAIDECLASGLLLHRNDGLSFRHELIRQAVEHALPMFRKQRLHLAALEQLEAQGASPARRLHHAMGGGDETRIAALAPDAAEEASAMGSHKAAAQAWSAMLDLDIGEAALEAHARERYAFELHMIGALDDAIEQQTLALSIYSREGNLLKQGDCQRFLSRLYYVSGNRLAAEIEGNAAVACLEPLPESAELALAYANLAQLAMLSEEMDEAVGWSEKAEPIAERFNRPDILATVYNNWGTAIQLEKPGRAAEMVERSIALGIAAGSQEHVARAYTNLGWMKLRRLCFNEADEILQQGISYCVDNELNILHDYMAGTRAQALLGLGRWGEAEQIGREIADRDGNTLLMRNPAVRSLAQILVRRGDPGVTELMDELRRHMVQGRETPRFVHYALVVAERAWTSGAAPEPAVALLDEALAMCGPHHSPYSQGELWYWRKRLDPATETRSYGLDTPWALLAEWKPGAAAAIWDGLGMPFEQALALAEGDDTQVREALDILVRLGAAATEARLRLELADRGLRIGSRGPRASTRGNPYQLTRREMQILRQLDLGLTNKQIGDALFVSAKTVDHHVASILGKLDARNRGEAAAKARREGLLPDQSLSCSD